ncbi:MAG: hypothetical protein WC233_03325 [Sphaerochaeta sp.]
MNKNTLYNVILTARYYLSEHAMILLDYQRNGDVAFREKRNHVMRLMLMIQPLERHYYTIVDSGHSGLLSDEEVLMLTQKLNELSMLDVKN